MATTDQQVLTWLQTKVNETADGGATWPSELWTASEVIGYINQRQQRFLGDTAIYYGLANIVVNPGQPRYAGPNDYSIIRRVGFITPTGSTYALIPSNLMEADLGIPDWTSKRVLQPKVYMADVEFGEFQIAPLPLQPATMELLYVPAGDSVDGTGQILTVPDEFMPTIRWGCLADMLMKAGRGQDIPRAQYAEGRYQQGVALAQMRVKGIV